MKKYSVLMLLAVLLACAMNARADEPFRKHRYDSWKVLGLPEGAIVFAGNSITDMHAWSEAFGNDARVVNRGNSGGYSFEVLDNVESWVRFQPAKVFIKIGTNDLGTDYNEASIAKNIRQTVDIIRRESPSTEIYLQSIIPAYDQKYKTLATIQATNVLIKQIADETENTAYVDLYSKLTAVPSGQPYSYDGLHLTAYGYKIWTEAIKDLVGIQPVYPASTQQAQTSAGLRGSHGMRATYFSMLPITPADVLFFGDEMVKNGEWNELLHNANVKNRGTGWGYEGTGGNVIPTISADVEATFAQTEGVSKTSPKQILLYTGTNTVNSGQLDLAKTDYQALVKKLQEKAPGCPIGVVSLLPTQLANCNGYIKTFNAWLKDLAAQTDGVEYIDIHTAVANSEGAINPAYFVFNNAYLTGLGYVQVARELAKHIEGCTVISDDEAQQRVATTNARAALNKAICETDVTEFGAGTDITNFPVTIRRQTEPELGVRVFDNDASSVPYRIPAVAKNKQGDLIFVTDYRYSKADIGMATNGKLDLRVRTLSADSVWSDVSTLAACITSGKFTAFGDPCIVADRESNRVMVTSCCGNVSFPNGTHDNHQGWARFYSEDGGKTWGQHTDISQQVFDQLDKRSDGPIRCFFIGSGKISQSQRVKVGDYYRIYCAALVKTGDGTNCNYVFYSDDFGLNWKLLGQPDDCPIPSGGDEPKADELPDGSILISSRVTGGRYYNVYHFTNTEKGEGQWGTMTFSGNSNKGVTAEGNSCNGEIIILPVQRVEDGRKTYLLLQSVPFGSGRANVGIYYKELSDLSKYRTSAEVAPNWDGKYQVTRKDAAYSTMCLDKDNKLAFFYEESGYNGGYNMIYRKISVEELTGGKYYGKLGNNETQAAPVNNKAKTTVPRRGVSIVGGKKMIK